MNKDKKCDCHYEFGKDHFKKPLGSDKEKVRLENMYEFGEEFFRDSKKNKQRKP